MNEGLNISLILFGTAREVKKVVQPPGEHLFLVKHCQNLEEA